MICTPIGIGSSGTGTATTGSPMKEIGWVWMPILARTGSSTPSSTKVACPSFGATQGVAGAMITSTDLNSSSTRARYQRRNFCARSTSGAGIIAPASSRSRTAGSKSFGRLRRRSRCSEAPSAGGDDIGGGAGARGFGDFDDARGAERPGDAGDGLDGFGENVVLKISAGDRDPQTADVLRQQRRHRLGGPGRARRVVRIRSLHRVIGQREIADVARERAEMIEAEDERKRPCARQPAVGRLQSEDSAERRRHPDRAVGVGPQRQRHQAAADGAAGAARRAAGHPRHVMRIARRTVMHILAGEVVGVFAHIERADQHRAGRLHALDQGGVARRRLEVAIDLRSGAGRQPLHVEQVLHRERHAGERAGIFPGRDRGIDCARPGARAIGGHVGEGIQDGIVLGDPRQRRFGHAERRHLSAGHGLRDFRGRQPVAVGGHGEIRLQRHWPARFRLAARIHPPAAPASATPRDWPSPPASRHRRPAAPRAFDDGVDIVIKRIGGHNSLRSARSVNRQRRMWNRRQQFPCIGILRIAQAHARTDPARRFVPSASQ